MAVTIRDVAKAAGVSASTVSRALSLPDIVDPSTRERVLRAADQLGYQPNRAARGLITGRTGNLGLIVPDLANPFFPMVIKGIQAQAMDADYAVFLADSDEKPALEIGLVRALAVQVDGIILCSPRMSDAELREAAGCVPVVLANRRSGLLPASLVDNAGGLREAVDHLVALGHRRIGFIAGPRSSWSSSERLRALRAAVEAVRVELVEIGNFAPQFEGGVAATDATLASDITAVITYNDLMALGLIQTLASRGIEVPRRLSVIGIDDIPTSAMVHPSLTTLYVPKEQVGRVSVDLMVQLLGDPQADARPQRELPTRLIVRNTTTVPPL
ncbi:LacI family DNA-binding transcriptional regulator [Streptomyces sp. NBC_01320]|uniref:LacI family DNA-binding transcriptional regulator n=1 Tax=Streptomyces sp. NBC_01320 TaxID=2903824 RepID=UPI002E110C4F|nr:LacI family transcriptional regulator [Streptomyces sp. NBC_01320]